MRRSKLCGKFLVIFLGFLLFLNGLPLGSSFAQENRGMIFFEGETVPVVREPYTTVDLRIVAANLTEEHPQIVLKNVAILDEVGKKVKEEKTEKKLANLSVKIEDEEVLRENLGLRKKDSRKRNKKLLLSEEDVESGLYLGNLELDLRSIKPSLKVGDEVPFTVTGTFSVGESDAKVARQLFILYSDPLPRPQDGKGFWVPGDGHVHTAYSHEWIIPSYIKPSSRAAAAASVGLGWLNITDHAPNMNLSDWTGLVQDCERATSESGVITLPGLELSTMDVDELVYKPEDGDYQKPYDSHYLAYDLSGFIVQPDTLGERYRKGWTGQKVISETNNNNPGASFGVIAHPFSWSYPWCPYWDEASGYSGIELINGGEYLFDNPFGISQSIAKWDELLKNGLSNTLSNGKFACGTSNSDVHFGLHTFGQTVTYLHLPGQDGFSSSAVQEARRSGRAVASSDGSVACFTLNGARIGDVITVSSGDPIEIRVHAKAVDRKRVRKIRLVSSYAEPEKFPAHGRDYQRTITIDKTKQSDYPYPSSSCYFRVEVDFAYRGVIYTCYTNPIWVKVGGQNVLVNSSFETGDTSGWKVVNLRNATSSVVSGDAADGSYCYGIYHTSAVGWYRSDWSSIGQNINGIIEPNTSYTVGFYYRTTDPYPFRIATTDTTLMMHSTAMVTVSNPITDGQWHYVSATFSRSPAELNYEPYLAFFYDYSTPGTVYVDCITCSAGS